MRDDSTAVDSSQAGLALIAVTALAIAATCLELFMPLALIGLAELTPDGTLPANQNAAVAGGPHHDPPRDAADAAATHRLALKPPAGLLSSTLPRHWPRASRPNDWNCQWC